MDFLLDIVEFNTTISYKWIFILIGAYFLIFWIGSILYVWENSRYYTRSFFVKFFFSSLALLFGVFGLLAYFFLRELFLLRTNSSRDTCFKCGSPTVLEGKYCPNCGAKVLQGCNKCGRDIHLKDKYCFFCGKKQSTKRDQVNKISVKSLSGRIMRLFEALNKINLSLLNKLAMVVHRPKRK